MLSCLSNWLTTFPCDLSKVARLPKFSRPLELALLCGGIDAPGVFLQDNNFWWVPRYFFDIASFLRAPLEAIHGTDVVNNFNLGPHHGNLCQQDFQSWERVDCNGGCDMLPC